jgi:hypothetical protein
MNPDQMKKIFKIAWNCRWRFLSGSIVLFFSLLLSCETSTVRAIHLCNDSLETAYLGALPCSDCRYVETILELRFNQTYIMSTRFIGKEDDIQFEVRGPFNWIGDGTYIHLIDYEGPSYFKVENGSLIQVKEDLSYFEDPVDTRYRLTRYPMGVAPE